MKFALDKVVDFLKAEEIIDIRVFTVWLTKMFKTEVSEEQIERIKEKRLNLLENGKKTAKESIATLAALEEEVILKAHSSINEEGIVIEEIVGYTLPKESRGGVSDANITSSSGLITIDGLGPFGDGDHTHSERAKKDTFADRIELSRIILLNLI